MLRFLWIILLTSSLTACSWFQNNTDDNHAGMCKELKRQIIFNAATPDSTAATEQRAELNRLNKSYAAQGC